MTTAVAGISPYQRMVRKTAREHRLFSVLWELTYRCNERCTHCYLSRPESPVGELSTEEARSVVDDLAEMGALHLAFTGGELLLREDFFAIAGYAREKGFALRLLTNGSLITPQRADAIQSLQPLGVEISLHGARAATHDRITQVPGSFDRTVRAFRLLAERGVRTVVKTPLMNENLEEFDQVRRLAEGLGAIFRYDITIVARDDGCTTTLRHRLTEENLLHLFRQEMPDRWTPPEIHPEDHLCSAALNHLCIGPYGEVYPCVQIRTPAGSLRRQSLRQIWADSPLLGRIRGLVESSFSSCSVCHLRPHCVRCMGVAWLEDGDLLGPSSSACREAKLRCQVLQEKGAL